MEYIEVAQESAPGVGDFDCNTLGLIGVTPFTGSAAQFYNYDSPEHNVSFGGTLPYGAPYIDNTNLLFVRTTVDGLTMVVIHDQPVHGQSFGNGGGTADMLVEVFGSSTTPTRTQQDDTHDNSDTFITRPGPGGSTQFVSLNTWGSPNTDGQTISGLSGNWSAYARFIAAPTSIVDWQVLGADGAYRFVAMDTGRRVRFRPAPTPTPSFPGSLLALYTFEALDFGQAIDQSGLNHHAYTWSGSNGGIPPLVPGGREGNAASLGNQSRFRVDLAIGPAQYPKVTFGAWVKAGRLEDAHLFGTGNGGGANDRGLVLKQGSDSTWHWTAPARNSQIGINDAFTRATTSAYQFVAAVYDKDAGRVRIYVDGASLEANSNAMGNGNEWLGIGGNPSNGNGTQLTGAIDNAFIISETLTNARLDEIRLGGYHRIPTCATIFRHPACTTACPNTTATLSVDAGGSQLVSPLRFQWRRNSVALDTLRNPSAATATLVIQAVRGADAGSYDCVVTNGCGTVTSFPATLTVCDSDFNCDGFPDIFDYDEFVACFEGISCPPGVTADFNNDGFADAFDYDDFVAAFEAGC